MDVDLYLVSVLNENQRITEVSHVGSDEFFLKISDLIVVDLDDHLRAVTELGQAFTAHACSCCAVQFCNALENSQVY